MGLRNEMNEFHVMMASNMQMAAIRGDGCCLSSFFVKIECTTISKEKMDTMATIPWIVVSTYKLLV